MKIARLAEEKGWNQEDFARIAQLNRHTVRQILQARPGRRLRNATISQCARAFGMSVHDLRTLPLNQLLLRLHGESAHGEDALKFLREQATLPELQHWLERNELRAKQLQPDEIREILAMQAPGGALERLGVEQVIERIERRRRVLLQLRDLAESDYFPLIEQFVAIVHEQSKGKSVRR